MQRMCRMIPQWPGNIRRGILAQVAGRRISSQKEPRGNGVNDGDRRSPGEFAFLMALWWVAWTHVKCAPTWRTGVRLVTLAQWPFIGGL